MVNLLDSFLDLMKLFLAVESDFMKSLKERMGGGKERKMNGGSSTADHVKDRRKRLKQKLFQTESAIKNFYQKSSPPNVTLNIKVFRVLSNTPRMLLLR
jgi:hypothetical protein